MSGVWVFKNGVFRLMENPQGERQTDGKKKKALVYLPTGEMVTSYGMLERLLIGLGWERYYSGEPNLLQFQSHSSIDLISLPSDFSNFNSIHMYDILVKNPNVFHVRDASV